MLSFYDIPIGRGEEAACRRCAGAPTPGHVDASALTRRIDDVIAARPGAGLLLSDTGSGEHADLYGLVAHAVRAGVTRVGVRVPGRTLADSPAAAGLLKSGARVFEVPFLGSSPESHDLLTGVPGDLEATSAGVRNIREAAEALGMRVAVRARIQVCRHNLQDLPATVMHCAQTGVSSVVLVCPKELDPRRSAEWLAAACDTGTVNRIWVTVTGMVAGALGDKALHTVDPLTILEVP